MAEKGYYIGIDAGGTKTLLTSEDAMSGRRTVFQGGPLNICSVPEQEAYAAAAQLLAEAIRHAEGTCLGIGIGAAGASNPKTCAFYGYVINEILPGVPFVVDTDARAALYGALAGEEGLIIIAGTGSVCYGEWKGKSAQCGGGGHIIDDGGSGYMIGREILSAVLRSWDGRAEATLLAELLRRHAGINSQSELIDFVYNSTNGKKEIASLAVLIDEACAEKDPAAMDIISRAAGELALLADGAARQLDIRESAKLAMGGSMLLKNRYLREALTEKISISCPFLTYTDTRENASCGAIRMFKKMMKQNG